MQNGQIPASQLHEVPGPGRLRTGGPYEAWMAMRADILAHGGPAIELAGEISGYRDLAGQRQMRAYWCGQGMCYRAAVPGTSNHGNGAAGDVKTEHIVWVQRFGPKHGWSHAEGARVGEPWHWVYVGGYRPPIDPLAGLTKRERAWVHEYAKLKRLKRDRGRRRVLRRYMRRQRKAIWRAAQKTGWSKRHRRKRYTILRRYST